MFYRPNLWEHSHRVLWIMEELIPLAEKYLTFDPEKARTLALVHDDVEIIVGDMASHKKALLSKEDSQKMQKEEEIAIAKLAFKFPEKINGYSYRELLLHSSKKDCIEAKLVSYVDKLDAQCESLHEVLAGNIELLRSVGFYIRTLATFYYKYPELKELLHDTTSPLTYISQIPDEAPFVGSRYIHLLKPHTQESIFLESDFPFYNEWKRIVVEHGGKEGLKWLIDQKEFLK